MKRIISVLAISVLILGAGLIGWVLGRGTMETSAATVSTTDITPAEPTTNMTTATTATTVETPAVDWKLDMDGVLTIYGNGYVDYRWEGNTRIKELIIQEGITGIERDAFSRCINLEKITLPASLKSIGEWAFNGCSNVKEAHITDLAAFCSIEYGEGASNVFSYEPGVLYLNGEPVVDLVIPEGVTEIGSGAFGLCKGLKSVTIPDSVKIIHDTAFWHCADITNIDLGKGVESIGYSALHNCGKIESITIPASVKKIEEDAFSGCYSLGTVIFEGDAPSLGLTCFKNVTAQIQYPADNSTWTDDVMKNYGGTLIWPEKGQDTEEPSGS